MTHPDPTSHYLSIDNPRDVTGVPLPDVPQLGLAQLLSAQPQRLQSGPPSTQSFCRNISRIRHYSHDGPSFPLSPCYAFSLSIRPHPSLRSAAAHLANVPIKVPRRPLHLPGGLEQINPSPLLCPQQTGGSDVIKGGTSVFRDFLALGGRFLPLARVRLIWTREEKGSAELFEGGREEEVGQAK